MKYLAIVILLIALPLGYYLISPVWRVVELNEPSPIATTTEVVGKTPETMPPAERAEYETAMKAASTVKKEMQDAMPKTVTVLSSGSFVSVAHDVSGSAKVIDSSGGKIIRFENFSTLNGPDLRIYLSADLGANDSIDLGAIRATKGNVNYEVPSSVDLQKYNKVLVWCRQFSVLFGYAELK